MKISRRSVLQALPLAAAVPAVEAQAQPAVEPDAELGGARQYLQTGARVVRQVNLAMHVEPAMRFAPRG